MKIKITPSKETIITFFSIMLAALFVVPSAIVFADHPDASVGACFGNGSYSDADKVLCQDHFRVDGDIANCRSGGTPDSIVRCLDRVRPASDGYGASSLQTLTPSDPVDCNAPVGGGGSFGGGGSSGSWDEGPVAASDDGCITNPTGNGADAIEDTLTCEDGQEGIQLSNPVDDGSGNDTNCLPFRADDNTPLEDNPIIRYLAILIRFVMVGIGIIIAAVIVIAGIRYTAAKGNPQETAAAKDMIQRAIISVVMYAFSGAIINFLIPGGLL